jgi:hypothetical protein
MKTQINNLVKGNQFQAGTNSVERNLVASKVISENPESMKIVIRGHVINLDAKYSISGKSVQYIAEIPTQLYNSFNGEFGLPKSNPKAFLIINGDMTANFQTNSKKVFYSNIDNSEITIN